MFYQITITDEGVTVLEQKDYLVDYTVMDDDSEVRDEIFHAVKELIDNRMTYDYAGRHNVEVSNHNEDPPIREFLTSNVCPTCLAERVWDADHFPNAWRHVANDSRWCDAVGTAEPEAPLPSLNLKWDDEKDEILTVPAKDRLPKPTYRLSKGQHYVWMEALGEWHVQATGVIVCGWCSKPGSVGIDGHFCEEYLNPQEGEEGYVGD